jgi:hypothetical protein
MSECRIRSWSGRKEGTNEQGEEKFELTMPILAVSWRS